MVETPRQLIDALGGPAEVAEFLGIVPGAVYNALAENRLRERWHYRLAKECDRRRIKYDPKLFGVAAH